MTVAPLQMMMALLLLLEMVALLEHECPTGPILKVLGLAIWGERRLVWTCGVVGNHFYYGVEGLK